MSKKIIYVLSVILALLVFILIGVTINYKFSSTKTKIETVSDTSDSTKEDVIDSSSVEEKEVHPVEIIPEEENEILEAVKSKDYTKLKDIADRDNHNIDVAFIVGEMCLQGIGTNQDIYEASHYINVAASNGNQNAFWIYSMMLFMGESTITQDYETAAKYAYALHGQEPQANEMLGYMYKLGLGVENNNQISDMYMSGKIKDEPAIDTSDILIRKVDYQKDETRQAVDELSKELLETQEYAKYKDELVLLAGMNAEIVNQTSIFGKDNWLFWKHPNDGDSYHDYVGDNAYTDEEMEKIAQSLKKQKEAVAQKGARFVLLVIPNKETVYYEYMPSYIKRVDTLSRMDKLVNYLQANTDLEIVYLREDFEKYKNDIQLYYKTDTHTNMKGSFLCVSKLMKMLYDKDMDVNSTEFQVHMRDYCGDIGTMINRTDRYNLDTVFFLDQSAAHEEDKVGDSVLLIGDSFSEFLSIEMQYYFTGGLEHIMIRDHNYNYYESMNSKINNLDCNVVVWEVTERFAQRLVQ